MNESVDSETGNNESGIASPVVSEISDIDINSEIGSNEIGYNESDDSESGDTERDDSKRVIGIDVETESE